MTKHKFVLTELSTILTPKIIGLLVDSVETTYSPWAILLVRFSDQSEPLPSLTKYEELFTTIGNSKLNMVDFFKDMSHGKLDLSGSRVFGWYTLSALKTNYVGNTYPQPAGKLNRNGLLDAARAAATASGVDLTKFAGVVVSAFGGVDLCGFVGGMAAICDSFSLTPSLLGQEMGHGYGLDHARHNGSADDYRDPWDVMSTAAYPHMQAPNSDWGTVGPALNAWNMRSRGWLDESRVWRSSSSHYTETIQLRPLHQHNRFGWLAIEIDGFLIEFRVKEKWDAAIPRPCILVHRFQGNQSYLMPSAAGSDDLIEGDIFEFGNPNIPFLPYVMITVGSIDPNGHIATITVVRRAASKPPQYIDFVELLGGITVDGGGTIIHGGKVVKVPPNNPIVEVLKQAVRYLNVQHYDTGVDRALAEKQDAALSMIRASAKLLSDLEFVSEHPPGYRPQNQIDKGEETAS
ncbi:MAG: hypothetical protein H0X72_01670 [Acidobacteria bacterium]|nr:hypothetical protein [Acidobacteriota bacterium]